jgi:3-oxoacyl-[acyl-carrier-protein] synthase-1
MQRVVVTGIGIVSSIGNNRKEVLRSLREGCSGLDFVPEMKELGYRCHVAGLVRGLTTEGIGKHRLRTMSELSRFALVAAREALMDARIAPHMVSHMRAGVAIGTGGGGTNDAARAECCLMARKHPTQLGGAGVMKILNSTAALNVATWLGVQGRCYSVSSACATGADNIGHGYELIQHGLLDLCLCGGADENGIDTFWGFGDAMSAMPTDYNDRPQAACRPYDRDRQGMVLSEGAGVVILESLDHAERRGARIYAEMVGYGSANDGGTMFEPNGTGLRRCLEEALEMANAAGVGAIDYVNPHGAGTKVGDVVEVQVMREIFGPLSPLISSTKALNGHSGGATGAHEAIYTLLMLQEGFVVPTANLEHVAPECVGVRHVQAPVQAALQTGMTFNAGLGGTNACLIFRKWEGAGGERARGRFMSGHTDALRAEGRFLKE